MDGEEEQVRFKDPTTLGLHRILRQVGIDLSAHDAGFDNSGANGVVALADADVSDGEDRFEDEPSDVESAGEKEDREAQARRRATEESRWMKRAMEMQRAVQPKTVKAKADPLEKVRKVWPEWEKGQRMKMTEIFYDTPLMQSNREAELHKAKRRKLEDGSGKTCEPVQNLENEHKLIGVDHIKITPSTALPPSQAHLTTGLPELEFHDAQQPIYEGALGVHFEKDWIKGARAARRKEMLDAPGKPDLAEAFDAENQTRRPLDMVDWESQIVFNSE